MVRACNVLGRRVADAQRLLELRRLVGVHGQHRAEELVAHRLVLGVLGHDDRRLDEVADRVVAATAADHLAA